MRHSFLNSTFMLSATLLAALLFSCPGESPAQFLPGPPVELAVPIEPTPFKRDGKINLVYEVHITNLGQPTLLMTSAEIFGGDDDGAAPLAKYADKEIVERIARPVPALKLSDARMIEGGKRAIFYVWLALEGQPTAPLRLRHRFTFKPLLGSGAEQSVEGARIEVRKRQAAVLGPPLRHSVWAARFLSNNAAHRRGFLPLNGKSSISQRFAIDFSMFNSEWKYARDPWLKNSDVYGYGAEVIAVADGVVANVRDRIPENDPSTPSGALPNTLDTAMGNFIALDIGDGNYAFYAHLQPRSLRVKVGDRVRRGQTLALVGNSGGSTGPHLHFQVSSTKIPHESEGLPYVFDSFEVLGMDSLEQFLKGEYRPDPNFKAKQYRMEMPPDMAIVRFP